MRKIALHGYSTASPVQHGSQGVSKRVSPRRRWRSANTTAIITTGTAQRTNQRASVVSSAADEASLESVPTSQAHPTDSPGDGHGQALPRTAPYWTWG